MTRAIGQAIAAAVLCVAPTALAEPVTVLGPELFLIPFFFALPVAIILLVVAFKKRATAAGTFCITLVLIYTVLLGAIYVAVLPHWAEGEIVLASLVVLALFTITLVFYFFTARRRRLVWTASTIVTCVGLAFMTPAIVNYRYYTTIDNDPLENPNDAITSVAAGLIQLSDGRLLKIEERYFGADEPVDAIVTPLGADRFKIAVRSPTPGYAGSARDRYQRDMAAVFQFPRTEIARDAYVRRELGEALWVGEQREKDLKLYFAADAKECSADVVAALLSAGANSKMDFGGKSWSPLFRAIFNGCVETVGALIDAGADVNIADDKKNTPLHFAAWRPMWRDGTDRTVAVSKMLVDAGANISAKNDKGFTPLHNAAVESAAKTKYLIAAGADVLAINKDGQTPLELARWYYGQGYGNRNEAPLIIAALEAAHNET